MKEFFLKNKVLIIVILVAFAVACTVIVTRMAVESKNKTYDIVLDYQETFQLAEQSENDIEWWLDEFKDMGIKKVGLNEENLTTLMNGEYLDINAKMMSKVMTEVNWEDDYSPEFVEMMTAYGYDEYDVIVNMGDKASYDFVTNAMLARYDNDKIITLESDDGGYLLFNGTPDDALYTEKSKLEDSKEEGVTEYKKVEGSRIMSLSLGVYEPKVEMLKAAGFQVIPRPVGYPGFNDMRFLKAVLDDYERLDIVPEYWISGSVAEPGYDEPEKCLEFLTEYMTDNDITLTLIEQTTQLMHIEQEGMGELSASLGNKSVRAFTVWNYIQYRYDYYGYEGSKEIENTLYRAIDERNIRVIYYKPIRTQNDFFAYVTDPDAYHELFSSLNERLADNGFEYGSASVMANYNVNTIVKILISIGSLLAALLLLCSVIPVNRKWKIILGVLGSVGVVAAYYILPNTAELLAAFGAALVFACLGITFYKHQAVAVENRFGLEKGEKIDFTKVIPVAVGTLICAVIIALIGGIMTAAPISSIEYMLELQIFRGVKVAQLLPIAYFAIAYLAYFGFGAKKKEVGRLEWGDLKDMMMTPIKLWMVLLGLVFLAAGAYYVLRTGHEFVSATSFEMVFRNWLEELLIARPRNKEFLFGFPCIMMMVYAAFRKSRFWTIVFGIGGVIGITSVVNTFMHIRTPLYLGFIRTGYSLLFGLVIGVIAILVAELIYRLYKKAERRIVGV